MLRPGEYALLVDKIEAKAGPAALTAETRRQTDIVADNRLMSLYGVDPAEVDRVLRSLFREEAATTLRTFSENLPVAVGNAGAGLQSALANTMVEAKRSRESGGNAEGKAPHTTLRARLHERIA